MLHFCQYFVIFLILSPACLLRSLALIYHIEVPFSPYGVLWLCAAESQNVWYGIVEFNIPLGHFGDDRRMLLSSLDKIMSCRCHQMMTGMFLSVK